MPLILLINPKVGKDRCPYTEDRAAREPLAILALGSYVKTAEIEVRLLDAVLYEEELGMIIRSFEEGKSRVRDRVLSVPKAKYADDSRAPQP